MANENDMKTSTAAGPNGTESPVKSPVSVPLLSETEPHLSPRDNRWGRSIEWFDFDAREVHGWLTPLPEVGDVFDAEMQSGNIARFKFTEVRPTYNPPDMFFGHVEFVTMFRPAA